MHMLVSHLKTYRYMQKNENMVTCAHIEYINVSRVYICTYIPIQYICTLLEIYLYTVVFKQNVI